MRRIANLHLQRKIEKFAGSIFVDYHDLPSLHDNILFHIAVPKRTLTRKINLSQPKIKLTTPNTSQIKIMYSENHENASKRAYSAETARRPFFFNFYTIFYAKTIQDAPPNTANKKETPKATNVNDQFTSTSLNSSKFFCYSVDKLLLFP